MEPGEGRVDHPTWRCSLSLTKDERTAILRRGGLSMFVGCRRFYKKYSDNRLRCKRFTRKIG